MIWLKSCPRCNEGDLYEERDLYGRFLACLQCGYYLTEAEEVVLRYRSACRQAALAEKSDSRKAPALAA